MKVAIDGRCASGKTLLAGELARILKAEGLDVLRPSVDGFHHPREQRYRQGEYSAAGYYEDAWDYQTIIDFLLEPLSGDVFPVLCRQIARDVRTDMADTTPPVSASAEAVLLFEGLFLFRPGLDRYWDLRILADVDAATSLRRSMERDTGINGPAGVVQRKWDLRYEPAWRRYAAEEQPEVKADLLVDNHVCFNPSLIYVRAQDV